MTTDGMGYGEGLKVAGKQPKKQSSSVELRHDSQFVSLKTLAELWDCSRTTVARRLEDAGVKGYYLGNGMRGAKRYLKEDVDRFLETLVQAE